MKIRWRVRSGEPGLRVGVAVLILVTILSAGAPFFTAFDPDSHNQPEQKRYLAPSMDHPFGCDQFGRDVFARVLFGGRVSLVIAFVVVAFSVTLGLGVGAFAGIAGGPVDRIVVGILDIVLSFPVMFLAVTSLALIGSSALSLVIVLVVTGWTDVARLVRSEIYSLKTQTFALRARAAGIPRIRLAVRHLVPNVLPTVMVATVLRFADVILLESALSFLGLGFGPPTASWGGIINDGRMVLSSAWWLTLFPGLAIVLTTGSLHLIADKLRIRS